MSAAFLLSIAFLINETLTKLWHYANNPLIRPGCSVRGTQKKECRIAIFRICFVNFFSIRPMIFVWTVLWFPHPAIFSIVYVIGVPVLIVLHFFSLSVNRYKKSRIQEHHAEKLSCGFLMHHFSDKMEIAPPWMICRMASAYWSAWLIEKSPCLKPFIRCSLQEGRALQIASAERRISPVSFSPT